MDIGRDALGSAEKLVAPNKYGMSLNLKYKAQQWIRKHKDLVIDLNGRFQFRKDYNGRLWETPVFGVCRCNIEIESEMSIYIPLKDNGLQLNLQ